MRSFCIIGLCVSLVVAAPFISEGPEWQLPLNGDNGHTYAGINVDLNAQRLLQFEIGLPVWMTEFEKIQAKARGERFFDITETQDLGLFPTRLRSFDFPSPNATEKVESILKTLSTKELEKNLRKLTSFKTRYYLSDTGRQSQKWLFSKISELTNEYASSSLRDSINVIEFPHSWGQNSIIARINGSSTEDDGVIVIGAHQDSTNLVPSLPAPGADDDGSGTITILEAYRALIAADFKPARTIEFHWYSAEEGGLLGSQAIVKEYLARSANVVAMSQFDMTAWITRGTREVVGIMTDFVDPELTKFNMKLVEKYLEIPYAETKCGFACSDQASWEKAGYPSSFQMESPFELSNPNVHTVNDVIDVSDEFSFTHMLEFSKLAVAFAVELGGWEKK